MLVHGLAATQDIWSLSAAVLGRHRRTVTLDVPGFGDSAPVGPGFDLEAVADRIARGLTGRRLPVPFDLVGHSLGGAVALTLAAQRPRLVGRLVLVAPAGLRALPPIPARLLGPASEVWYRARRSVAPLSDLRWGRRLLLAATAADPARLSPAQARMMIDASTGAQRIGPALTAIAAGDLLPVLQRVPAPVGLIWGRHDRTVPLEVAQAIVAERPDAPLEVIDDAGHVPMVECPGVFAARLLGLLDRLDKDATTSRR